MKIVYNASYGGFILSYAGLNWMANRGHIYAASEALKISMPGFSGCGGGEDIDRDDPLLIEAIETLGSEAVSGFCASLAIADIPDGVEWEIDEYDGWESVVPPRMRWPEKETVE